MTFENVPTFELSTAQLTGVAGRDAALVPLVPDQRGLVKVGPAAAGARVLGRDGAAVRRQVLAAHLGQAGVHQAAGSQARVQGREDGPGFI